MPEQTKMRILEQRRLDNKENVACATNFPVLNLDEGKKKD